MNLPSRRAKIVATLGPSSSDLETIQNLIKAGVDVFRLNFSHGKKEDHEARFNDVRAASEKLGKPVAILQDLQGPKLRVGVFAGGSIEIIKGEELLLQLEKKPATGTKSAAATERKPASIKVIPYNYPNLAREIRAGHRIFIDDGNLEIVVTEISGDTIKAQVVFGGVVKDKKGMNFPDTKIGIESFTAKDREDLLFGLQLGVDYVALSFVRTAEDVRTIQRFMHIHKKNLPVVAKIEKGEAIENLHEILEVTDAVMVARGDLAVEVGTPQVPSLQKKIIRECNLRGIPVITATQMLESMVASARPTRAEASDVANAVLDGSDALMLSAESASGKFPVLAVSVMHNIILETEYRRKDSHLALRREEDIHPVTLREAPTNIMGAVEHAAARLAGWINAKAIACTTHTGKSARELAKYRPLAPILALTDDESVRRKLALVWGVRSARIEPTRDLDMLVNRAQEELGRLGLATKGDQVVFTAGWPPLKHGTTSLLQVITIRRELDPDKAKEPSGENLQGYRTRRAQFVLDQDLCIQCGGCVEVCPNDIFGMQNQKVYLKESNCKKCTFDDACMEICPTNAIEIMKLAD